MVVSSEFQRTIRQLMARPSGDFDADTIRLARNADALAIGFDLCNDMFIRPNGAVGGCSVDAEIIGFADPSPTRLISALLFGSKRLPALAELVPDRPTEAMTCSQCSGDGKHPIATSTWCDACGGVGWVADHYEF